MGRIIVLDEQTACKIAAGEVIERPASVVKEMVENSIDANATSISVEIKAGGIKYIRISDNGQGFESDDAILAFDKHATSKIKRAEDLEGITTLGFRGEALASIAAVSDVELTSRTESAGNGIYVHIKGGSLIETGTSGCAKGTSFLVKDLFFNTPARYKFLKKDHTEAGYVANALENIALANPGISFKLVSNNETVLQTPGKGDLLSCIYSIYGRETASSLKEVKYDDSSITVTGYISDMQATYSNRNRQIFFVNGRHIKSKLLTSAIDQSYKTITMKGKFPFVVLNVKINPIMVDVNVHPAKTEVRFAEESKVFEAVYRSVTNTLFNYVQQTIPIVTKQEEHVINTFPQRKLPELNKIDFKTYEKYLTVKEEPKAENTPVYEKFEQIPINKEPAITVNEITENEPEEYQNEDNKIFTDCTIIGQVFNTYILLEYKESLVLMDQHAAHERIMYEEIRRMVAGEEPMEQMLLTPINIELSPAEWQILKNNLEYFKKFGIDMEEFGTSSAIIRSIPAILSESDILSFVLEGLARIQKRGASSLYSDETLYRMACKAAVKANRKLDIKEIKEILNKLSVLKNPRTCPHGRPVIIELTKSEVEKRFKRI